MLSKKAYVLIKPLLTFKQRNLMFVGQTKWRKEYTLGFVRPCCSMFFLFPKSGLPKGHTCPFTLKLNTQSSVHFFLVLEKLIKAKYPVIFMQAY